MAQRCRSFLIGVRLGEMFSWRLENATHRSRAVHQATMLSLVSCRLGVAFVSEATRWRCPKDVVFLSVTDLNLPLPFALIWRKDNASPAQAKIAIRINRLAAGNFGDCKSLRQGLFELRIDWGPGYRVYYGMIGRDCVLLLCGGDKRKQSADIERALEYLKDYKERAGTS